MNKEEFIKQRCEIDKITEEEFEKRYRVVKCNCGQPYCKGYRCLDLDGLSKENQELKKQNDSLKQKLNWIAFGDDSELALRYLRKIGYVDFDEERKVYINKHNNEPFLLKNEQEKDYYIKDNELNEYTEQLEYQVKSLKEQLEKKQNPLQGVFAQVNDDMLLRNCGAMQSEIDKYESQQKEFINYLEDKKISPVKCVLNSIGDKNQDYNMFKNKLDTLEEILSKYKEIIGDDK